MERERERLVRRWKAIRPKNGELPPEFRDTEEEPHDPRELEKSIQELEGIMEQISEPPVNWLEDPRRRPGRR